MSCQTIRLSQLCALVSMADRYRHQIRHGMTQADRDMATVEFSRTLDRIYHELRALKSSGTMDALDMLLHTLNCQDLQMPDTPGTRH